MVTTRAKGSIDYVLDEAATRAAHDSAGGGNGGGVKKESVGMLIDNEDVKAYIRNCREYDVPIDPSVVISLKTCWEALQPTRAFTEGCMLLDTNKRVKTLLSWT